MHRVRTLCVALGLTAVLLMAAGTSTVLAQNPRPAKDEPESLAGLMRNMGAGPQTPVTVLTAPAVQKELKLTEAQKGKVFNLSVSATQRQRDQFQSAFLGGQMNPRGLLAARDELRQQNDQAIANILDSTQRERFNQIVLRAEGPLSVARPDIAAKLRLNDTQREYVQSIVMQMQQNQFVLFARMRQGAAAGQVNPGQVSQLREMMAKVRDEATQQVGKVIDRKQKDAFNKLLGKPFDLSKLDGDADPGPAETAPASGATAKDNDKDKDKDKDKEPPKADGAAPREKSARGAGTSRKKARTRTTKPGP